MVLRCYLDIDKVCWLDSVSVHYISVLYVAVYVRIQFMLSRNSMLAVQYNKDSVLGFVLQWNWVSILLRPALRNGRYLASFLVKTGLDVFTYICNAGLRH